MYRNKSYKPKSVRKFTKRAGKTAAMNTKNPLRGGIRL